MVNVDRFQIDRQATIAKYRYIPLSARRESLEASSFAL